MVRNSVSMWLLVQLSLILLFGSPGPTWGIPAVLVWLDRRRSHELLLHANLGASPLWFWAASLAIVSALDLLMLALLSSVGGSLGFALLG